ncbi:MAG TPA: pyruvate kinase [Anaerolineae bacterium]|nr:pyruvate kinase [Anaerolineae bacterium]
MPVKITDSRPKKRTKIVATLGPTSSSEAVLRRMILAGMDVVRINFSHGEPEDLARLKQMVRKLCDELDVPIAILGDLRGPRIRVGEIEGGSVQLQTNQQFTLTPDEVMGNQERVSVSFQKLAQDVAVGSRILLDDGNIEIVVEKIKTNGEVVGRVTQGGELSSRRGVNLPGRRVSLPSITPKDFKDVDFAIEHEFDFLALSFVQSAEDVRQLNSLLASKGSQIPVIAKIERQNALVDIDSIVKEAYVVMVARGDLALEMSIQEVPIAQKRIIAACRQASTPVITATQMLESMINMHKPTRAEATDVANAILDGTDALMLSGETAIGKYPAETVAMMSSIAQYTERAWFKGQLSGPAALPPPDQIDANIAYISQIAAQSLSAKFIVIHTTTGATARRVACHRPQIPVLALSSIPASRRRLALTWGVESYTVEPIQDTQHMVEMALRQAVQSGGAVAGDIVVMAAGTPYGTAGRTNMLKVEEVPDALAVQRGRHD